jgi:hypothetical protein
MDEQSATHTPPPHVPLKQRLQRIALIGLAVLCAVLLLWIVIDGWLTASRHADALEELNIKSSTQLDRRSRSLLRLTAAAVATPAADALARNDVPALRSVVSQLRNQDGVRLCAIADAAGTIRASSDQRQEGTPLNRTFSMLMSHSDAIIVDTVSAGTYRLVANLRSGASAVGMLVLVYEATDTAPPSR